MTAQADRPIKPELEWKMKKLALAAAFAAAASNAQAGNLSEPVVEAPVIVSEASDSSSGILLPLLLLVLVAIAVAGSSGGTVPVI